MKQILLILFLLPALLRAEDSKTLLSDGIFAEEAEGDLNLASEKYEQLLKTFAAERKIAAIALYRLAKIRREEGKKEEAIKLYRQLLTEFPGVEPQQKLAKNRLSEFGEKIPNVTNPLANPEPALLAELRELRKTSPDVMPDNKFIKTAIEKHHPEILDFLHQNYGPKAIQGGLQRAVEAGNLELTKKLLDFGADPNSEEALGTSLVNGFETITNLLIERGANFKKSSPGILARLIRDPNDETIPKMRRAIELGANVTPEVEAPKNTGSHDWVRTYPTPLLLAVFTVELDIVKFLLGQGTDPNQVLFEKDVSALHLAVRQKSLPITEALLAAVADVNYKTITPKVYRRQEQVDPIPILSELPDPEDLIENQQLIRTLIEAGAPFPDSYFYRAIAKDDLDLVRFFLEHGAKIDGIPNSNSPIFHAIQGGRKEVAEFLREKGAKINPKIWGGAPSRSLTEVAS